MRVLKKPRKTGGGSTSDDESGQRRGSLKMKQNRRLVNPNFLFFCQIILLVIPITVLYAGLYFMNVSSPIIVVVCGVIIFGFLIVFICVRPFTAPEVKGEDTVPLTQDMSPPRQYEGTGIVTGGEAEKNKKHQVPSGPQEQPKPCPVSNGKMQDHQTVQDALIESCICPHNPAPHVTNQGDGVLSDAGSKTTLLSGKESSFHRPESSSEEDDGEDYLESADHRPKNKSKLSDSNSEKSTSSSLSIKQIEKRGLLDESSVSDDDVNKHNVVNFDMSNLLIDNNQQAKEGKYKELSLRSKVSEDTLSRKPVVTHPSTPKSSKHCIVRTTQPTNTSHVSRIDRTIPLNRSRSARATAVRRVFDEEPSAKRLRDETGYKECTSHSAAAKSRSITPERNMSLIEVGSSSPLSGHHLATPSPCRDKNKSTALPITIRLYPKSSTKQGIFEWVEPVKSPEYKKVPVGGLSSVIYNMQTIDIVDEEYKVPVDESIQTMLPLETNTLHQMMMSSFKDRATLFEDFGTQVTPTPEVSPKPSSVVYIVNEKKPLCSSSKTQMSELVRSDSKPRSLTSTTENVKLTTESYCQTIAQQSVQTSTTDIMVSKCNNSAQDHKHELKDQQQQTSKCGRASICNESILDFVMRRPFSGKSSSTVKNEKHGSLKSSGNSFSDSKAIFHNVRDRNSMVKGVNSVRRVIAVCNTSPSDGSGDGGTPNMSTCHSSRELLKHDLPYYIKSNEETWKIKGRDKQKVTIPKVVSKKGDRNDGRSKAFYSALYRGDNGKKYQPSKLGLLVTESSKEEVLSGKRKANISPRIKKKSRIKTDDGQNNGERDVKIATCKTSPKLDNKEVLMASQNKRPMSNKKNERCSNWSLQSPSLYGQSISYMQQSAGVHQKTHEKYQQLTVREDRTGEVKLSNPSTPNPFASSFADRLTSNCYKQSFTTDNRSPITKPQPSTRKQHFSIQKQESSRKLLLHPLTPQNPKNEDTGNHTIERNTDSQGGRFPFPPFNLDLSYGINYDHPKAMSPKNRKSYREEEHYDHKRRTSPSDRAKSRDTNSLLMDKGEVRSPVASPNRNKNRRAHHLDSTIFKKSSSSYDNVIIERVIRQKKKTLDSSSRFGHFGSDAKRKKQDTCASENKCFADARARNPIEAAHAEQKVQDASKEPQYSQEPPKIQKIVDLPQKSSIHEKPTASPKPKIPDTPPKLVTQKKVVSREDESHQMQALDEPLLSLHKKNVLNKGTTQRRRTEILVERRRSSWEFFLESKELRKLKKKREKQEEKIRKKNDMKKKKTIVKHAKRSIKNRFLHELMSALGFANKSQVEKKTKQNRELYPLDEFSSRSSKPFRMNIQSPD